MKQFFWFFWKNPFFWFFLVAIGLWLFQPSPFGLNRIERTQAPPDTVLIDIPYEIPVFPEPGITRPPETVEIWSSPPETPRPDSIRVTPDTVHVFIPRETIEYPVNFLTLWPNAPKLLAAEQDVTGLKLDLFWPRGEITRETWTLNSRRWDLRLVDDKFKLNDKNPKFWRLNIDSDLIISRNPRINLNMYSGPISTQFPVHLGWQFNMENEFNYGLLIKWKIR